MKLQYLCHILGVAPLAGMVTLCGAAEPPRDDGAAHDYPTIARVEYVNECIAKNGDKLAALYQCSCAIDHIANALTYDDFVEATTFARYATLPGPGGGIFRASDHGKELAKNFRELEADALRGCGATQRH